MFHRSPYLPPIFLALFACAIATAQNPFDPVPGAGADAGAFGSPFGAPEPNGEQVGATNGAARTESKDPLLRELKRYSSGNITQLATAIRSSIQISDWEGAASYLSLLGGKGLSDADSSMVAREIEPGYLLRLLQHESLTDDQRSVITTLLEAAQKHAQDRARLQGEIAKLGTDSYGERQKVITGLRSGGEAAVAELAAAYVASPPPVDRDEIFDVLRRFEPDATLTLQQFALYGEDSARAPALEGLIRLDLRAAMPDMVAAYLDAQSTGEEKQAAQNGLSRVLRGMPSSREADQYLGGNVKKAAAFAARVPRSQETRRIWQLAKDKKSIQWETVSQQHAYMRDAADAAARFMRLPDSASDSKLTATVAELGFRFMSDPGFGMQADYESRYGDKGASGNQLAMLEEVLRTAIRQRNEYAAIAAIRLMKFSGATQLVSASGIEPTVLVRAASHATSNVRYEAAIAIEKINRQLGYPGSSDVLHRWIEMSTLQRKPTALVLDARVHLTTNIINWLEALGYKTELVKSVAALSRRIELGGDIALLVATSQPADRHIIETVDLVRRRPLGGAFPILIYCQPTTTIWDENTSEPTYRLAGKSFVAGQHNNMSPEAFEAQRQKFLLFEKEVDTSPERQRRDIQAKYGKIKERQRIEEGLGQRWQAPLAVVEQIDSPYEFAQAVEQLLNKMPMPPLSSAQRSVYGRRGIEALAAIASSSDRQILYDLISHAPEVTRSVEAGGFSEAGLALLSGLGTQESQLILANLVTIHILPESTRQQAADAFATSIQRYGTRLSRADVSVQYDRFNAAEDEADRAVLTIILDAIEKRAGASSR